MTSAVRGLLPRLDRVAGSIRAVGGPRRCARRLDPLSTTLPKGANNQHCLQYMHFLDITWAREPSSRHDACSRPSRPLVPSSADGRSDGAALRGLAELDGGTSVAPSALEVTAMKFVRSSIVLSCLACGIALFACKKDKTGETTSTGVTETTGAGVGAQPMRFMSATANIAGARCERQVTCNQVGAQKRFETRDVCAREENKRTQSELRASDCPNGVDQKKLQTCLDTIARQDCDELATSLEAVDECNTSAICMP